MNSRARSLLVVSHACSRAVNRQPYAELQALGWDVRLVTVTELVQDGRVVASDPQEPGTPILRFLPLIGRSSRTYRFAGLEREIAAFRPDWVIADNDPHSVLAWQLAGWKSRLGYRLGFVTCENLSFSIPSLWRRRGWRGLGLGMFCAAIRQRVRRCTDLLWTINDAGGQLFREAGFARVEKTPLGFPEQQFCVDPARRAAARHRLNIDGAVVAYFGRLSPEKGVHLLLDALEEIAQPWTLLIDSFMPAGDYQQQLWNRLQEPAWATRVHWIEARHGEVAEYMNAADIVVLPSISTPQWVEQYGRVAPEAMACGCLVIASRSGALPELVDDAGWLFLEGDAAALRERLREALAELPHLQDLRNRAAERARDLLSSTAQARLWAEKMA
jgi:glycosyltransferase involved in cell wall biosynthesis